MHSRLRDIINEKHGSVDRFIAEKEVKMNRSHLFKLLSGERDNPTLDVLNELGRALDMDIKEIADALHNRYRD